MSAICERATANSDPGYPACRNTDTTSLCIYKYKFCYRRVYATATKLSVWSRFDGWVITSISAPLGFSLLGNSVTRRSLRRDSSGTFPLYLALSRCQLCVLGCLQRNGSGLRNGTYPIMNFAKLEMYALI